jgi:hypothetical protein
MTEDDKDALKEFMRGVAFTIGLAGIVILGFAILSGGEDVPINKSSVEVVDKYKECDIIRYTPHQVSEYKYFLYCEKNK